MTEKAIKAKDELEVAESSGMEVIYLDECVVSANTMPLKTYSLPRRPLKLDRKDYHKQTVAVLVAIAKGKGVV